MQLTRLRHDILAALAVAFASACGGGSCSGCDLEPLPEEGLPVGQTIEGAGQARVTSAGFDKISEIVPAIVDEVFADGICIPRQTGSFAGDYEFCHKNDCVDSSGNPGCQVDVNLDSIDVGAEDASTLGIDVQLDGDADVPARHQFAGSCTFDLTARDLRLEADIGVATDTGSGELQVALADLSIPNIDDALTIDGCSFASDFASFVKDTIGELIVDFLRPYIDDLIQGLLPDPLGLEGVLDMTPLLSDFRPQDDVKLELRAIPGGHANLEQGGLNLGMIAGINTDADPSDRSRGNATTPAACVPPIDPLDFSVEPYELPRSVRGTFRLPAVGAFAGDSDPEGHDVVLGVSETALNLAGYHAFASGALCLGIDTDTVSQLNLGTFGILVPSLSELGSQQGKDPMMVVVRPQNPIRATVGDGGDGSPNLTIHVDGLELDLYAFIFERFVRGFTLKVDLDLGIGVELTTDDEGRPALLPTLSGLDTESIGIEVLNPEFLREDKESLESVIPALFDLVVPLLSGGLGAFTLPEVAGFTLTDLQVERITTDEDDFLSIAGAFGASALVEAFADEYPALGQLAIARAAPAPARARTRAELVSVDTPGPDAVKAALAGEGGNLPEVVIDVDAYDDRGRPLEWTWRLGDGMWRPFSDEAPLVIRDRAFAFQGHYEIEVMSRVRGDYRTTDPDPVSIPVVIDSVPPDIDARGARAGGDRLIVSASDAVTSSDDIELAIAPPGASEPATDYAPGTLPLDRARSLAGRGGELQIFARDGAGNVASAAVDVRGLAPAAGGCRTGTGGGAGAGFAILAAIAALFARRRFPRRARAAAAVAAAGLAAFAGLGCGGRAVGEGQCRVDEDCAAQCGEGQVPVCSDNECACEDDVALGRVGQYSALAVDASGQAWISAYNSTHGDLVVARAEGSGRVPDAAWEFVDGVPDGPVIVEGSDVRSGIFDPGADVGRYTDVATSDAGTVFVSYFDADEGSLKLATRDENAWNPHTVDGGEIVDPASDFAIAGQYSSLALDAEGRPGVAYFAQQSIPDGGVRTQVRFAQARVAAPQGPSDWDITVVEEADVAAPDDEEGDDPYPIPPGVGLYVTAERDRGDRAVLVYYDRQEGSLRTAEMRDDGSFREPYVLDDGGGLDVGRFPSIAIDNSDTLHVSYVSASRSELLYLDTSGSEPEVVDDGYRVIGTTEDGAPIPEYHFVGDDSSLVVTAFGPVVAYQDATTHELLLASRAEDGAWEREILAGNEEPFAGGYGFYASSSYDGTSVRVSNWVVDQPNRASWVELHRRRVVE